jgi:glycosyltransferase involved in cell wall biosynthesis
MEQKSPLVSVIIPAFNVAEWLAETIHSVLAQTHRPVEVIVVDDGSTDGTPLVAQGFGNAVKYIRRLNGGVGAARNAGFRASTGEYVAFVDADDLWFPDKLARQVALLESKPDVGWVYSDALVVDHSARHVLDRVGRTWDLPEGDIVGSLLLNNFVACPTPLIRRALMEALGGFEELRSLTVAADWHMWLRLAAAAPAGCVRSPLARVRSHPGSMTGTMDLDSTYNGKVTVIEQVIALRPLQLEPLRSRAISNVQLGMGQWMIRRGDMRRARRMFVASIRSHPTNVRAAAHLVGSLFPAHPLKLALALRRRVVHSRVRASQ